MSDEGFRVVEVNDDSRMIVLSAHFPAPDYGPWGRLRLWTAHRLSALSYWVWPK